MYEERLEAGLTAKLALAIWRGTDVPDAVFAAPWARRRRLGFGHG
jgi:hypothetical protein